MNNQNLESICDELRRRICTGEIDGGEVLHEATLGKEFGLSRTPIRQVLHKLAIENFIETKTGVGSVVIANDRFDLTQDLIVCEGLLSLSKNREDVPLSVDDEISLSKIQILQKALSNTPSLAGYWDVVYQFNTLVAAHIPHDLVRENYKLITCRIYRRVIHLNKNTINRLVSSIEDELNLAAGSKTANALLTAKMQSISQLEKISGG